MIQVENLATQSEQEYTYLCAEKYLFKNNINIFCTALSNIYTYIGTSETQRNSKEANEMSLFITEYV